jgi:hypothetical protein
VSTAYLRASLKLWLRKHAYRQRKLNIAHQANNTAAIEKWNALLVTAGKMIRKRRLQLADTLPLREKAYEVACTLIGVMEQGGNNAGPMVSTIIRENGGGGPEPWCGDTMAYCYRHAGSKAVQRLWASVYYLGRIAGLHRTSDPLTGDLVRYTFDHVGMFVKDNRNGTIETIEGNTGSSGAVSDSATGGDGVYRKERSKTLVRDYLRVER